MVTDQPAMVIGVFRDRSLADQAIAELRNAGWDADQVHILGKNAGSMFGTLKKVFSDHESSPEDELAHVDMPDEQRALYQRELDAGSFVVVADPRGRLLETRDIFHRYGAYNVFLPFALGGEQVVPVREEVPHVEKRVVDVGEIRIHKRVITEQRTFTIPVTREEVTIERLPRNASAQVAAPQHPVHSVDGTGQPLAFQSPTQYPFSQNAAVAPPPPAPPPQDRAVTSDRSPSPLPATVEGLTQPASLTGQVAAAPYQEEVLQNGGTLRILVREEQVFIHKTPVVVEEIIVHKQAHQEIRNLIEPIKHEEVHIERTGNVPIREQTRENQRTGGPEQS